MDVQPLALGHSLYNAFGISQMTQTTGQDNFVQLVICSNNWGDISGARLNKTSSQRIIAQFGKKQGTNTEYQSKRPGERALQPLRDIDIAQNGNWVHRSAYGHM